MPFLHPTSNSRAKIFGLSLLALLLVGGGVSVGYYLAKPPDSPVPPALNDTLPLPNTVPSSTPVTAEPVNPSSSSTLATIISKESSLPTGIASAITWNERREIPRLGWLGVSTDTGVKSDYDTAAHYYQIGSFTYEGKTGRVVLLQTPPEGPGDDIWYRFIEYNDQIVLLGNYSSYRYQYFDSQQENGSVFKVWSSAFAGKLSVDNQLRIPALDFPEKLTGPAVRQTLMRQQSLPFRALYEPGNDEIIFTDTQFGAVRHATSTGGFYLTSVDGFAVNYAFNPIPEVLNEKGVPAITWSDAIVRTDDYAYTDFGGCGSTNYAAVIEPAAIRITTDLTAVGTTRAGFTMYELKDPNHSLLKNVYENQYSVSEPGAKLSYEKFVAAKPLLFFVDPFNRLIKLQNRRFIPAVECGKPVIYLYPEKTEAVEVKVAPQGGLSYSDPVYGNGWSVVAQPSGKLIEKSSGKTYPYLFWEGRGGLYETPTRGFVVPRNEVESTLRQKLAVLGLNTQETSDFLEFWLPRMQEKPYYFITFLGTQQMNALAPLAISPKPDTIFRILMDFTPLDRPFAVEPLPLGKTPARKGFTVVEWGGVLR